MDSLTSGELILRLLLAAGVGMAIGLEREWREKAAGFRTITLVSAGVAAFMLAAQHVLPGETIRMAAGISTGIGFLGAGTILRERGEVLGLTTAATVWVAAALGVAASVGAYTLTIAGTALSLFVLLALPLIDLDPMRLDYRTYEIRYEPGDWDELRSSRHLREAGLRVAVSGVSVTPEETTAIWLARGRRERHERAIAALLADASIVAFKVN